MIRLIMPLRTTASTRQLRPECVGGVHIPDGADFLDFPSDGTLCGEKTIVPIRSDRAVHLAITSVTNRAA